MKVAFVHDDLMRRGGAENVLIALHQIFPEAPIYTLCYRPELTYPEFRSKKIITSWFQYIAFNEKIMKWLFYPIGVWAMKSLSIAEYDLVIISTTFGAKYVNVSGTAKVFAYCYTPFRLIWRPESYNVYSNSSGLGRKLFDLVIARLKKIDLRYAARIDYFFAMTQETKERIIEAYQPDQLVQIVNPPVNLDNFKVSSKEGDYYLVVSRFEPYKKVDLAILAFNMLGKKLIIVGKGSQERYLKSIANENIEFKTNLEYDELSSLYSKCKAFIFPQYEDYGLTPLEANASGRPVIAYRRGGVLDTMIEKNNDSETGTAIFFDDQIPESIIEAVTKFETMSFDPQKLRAHAETFSIEHFKKEIESFIKTKLI